jgi:hypothetical protein
LFAGWLALAGPIPLPDEAPTGIFKDIYDLSGAVGQSAIVAAGSFIAYLLGILSVQLTTILVNMLQLRRFSLNLSPTLPGPSAKGLHSLQETVVSQLTLRAKKDDSLHKELDQARQYCGITQALDDDEVTRKMISVRLDIDPLVSKLKNDLQLMPLRLLDDKELVQTYTEFDRRRAEAEFRAAVALPIAGLAIIVASRSSPWWLLALAVSVALILDAKRTAISAADILAESLRARQPPPQSPAIDEISSGRLDFRHDWRERAAGAGYLPAMTALALTLETPDPGAAEQWFTPPAHAGDPTAMFRLAGLLHKKGSSADADTWYRKAAECGQPEAVEIELLRSELEMSASDVSRMKSAYANDPAAMTWLAEVLLGHNLVSKAKPWLRKAADMGYKPAVDAFKAAYVSSTTPDGPTAARPLPAGQPAELSSVRRLL